MNRNQTKELLLQSLETEIGGVQIYTRALECAVAEELREEWREYLDQTRNHVEVLRDLLDRLGLDENEESTGRAIVRELGRALVEAMTQALDSGDQTTAQLVATECVVIAETKDHQNWSLICEVARKSKGEEGKLLREAHEQLEKEEDEHYYHSLGWSRELWIQSLGMPAVIPPPEEQKDVQTAIGAARAKQARREML